MRKEDRQVNSYRKVNRIAYSYLEEFTQTKFALFLLGIWAFFEASVWFIAPDFLLVFLGSTRKNWKKFLGIAALCSLLGGITYFMAVLLAPSFFFSVLQKTPFVSQGMIELVMSFFSRFGVQATLLQSITLIPFKVWTNIAALNGINPMLYFIFVSISRALRFTFALLIARLLGGQEIVKNNFLPIAITYIILFFTLITL